MIVDIPDLEATTTLARSFARCVEQNRAVVPVLMRGQLGAGKTTFVRELVMALPGSYNAEVSSPSFNLLNLYPTTPPVGHFDLYRTSGLGFGADLEETLLASDHLCLVEWAEYLPPDALPETRIDMVWNVLGENRVVELSAHGETAQAFLACVRNTITT